MGEIKKRQRQHDDDGAEAETAHAGDKNADENEQYHRRAGFVFMAEHAAPIAGQLRHPIARRILSPMNRLAITVALEHFTAIMADELLRNPEYEKLMDPEHAKLWLWHAVEETEHKAVAFDVYRAVGGGYVRRAATRS